MYLKISTDIDIKYNKYYNMVQLVNKNQNKERVVCVLGFEKFCQENCVERKGTGTLKWDSLQEIFGDADLLPLWVADMEIQSPKAVRDALI